MSTQTHRASDLVELLRQKGGRLTAPRQRISEYLASATGHESAETIYRHLRRRFPSMGRATVFRTLALFETLGICRRIAPTQALGLFEHGSRTRHHDHMVCLGCGHIVEFYNPNIERLQESEAQRHGFLPIRHALEIAGYCRRCRRRMK